MLVSLLHHVLHQKNNVMFLLQLLLKVVGCCLPVLAQGLRLNWGVLLRGVCLYRLTGTTQHSAVIPAHRRVVTGPGTCSLRHFRPPQGFHGTGYMFFETFPSTTGRVVTGPGTYMFFGSYPSTTGRVFTGLDTCSLRHFRPQQGFHGTRHMFFEAFPPTAGFSRDRAHVLWGISAHRRVFTGPGTCSLRNFRPPQAGFSWDRARVLFGISQSTARFHGMGNMFILAFSPTAGFSRARTPVPWGIPPFTGLAGDRTRSMFLPCFIPFHGLRGTVTLSLGYPMVHPRDRVPTVENGRTEQKLLTISGAYCLRYILLYYCSKQRTFRRAKFSSKVQYNTLGLQIKIIHYLV